MEQDQPSREKECDHGVHATIVDAIRCAEKSLGISPGQKMQPYWGTMNDNSGLIVGWQCSSRKRWRLDYESRVRPGVNRQPRGPHINEENFELPPHLAKTVHLIEKPSLGGDLKVFLQWKKWTAAGQVDK